MYHACGQPFFDRLPPLKKGSQWIAITDRMRDFIFDYLAAHPEFIPAFRYSHAADELFFIRCSATPRLPGTTRIIRLSMPTGRTPGHTRNIVHKRLVSTVRAQVEGGEFPAFARKFDDGLDIARYREILFGQGTKAAR